MRSRLSPLAICVLLLFSTAPLTVGAGDEARNAEWTWPPTHVVISEVLVSASGEDYNGTDWNGDGDIGSSSDQYIEIWNPTSASVDVSNWRIDDVANGGSAPCMVGWNSTLGPDQRMVFFRENTKIELDYFDGDSVTLSNSWGDVIHQMSYPAEDSWWDTPYQLADDGSFPKWGDPSPGVDEPANWTSPSGGELCFTMSETRHEGAYILTGRVVPMTSENAVIEDGGVLILDGLIAAIWDRSANGGEIPAYVRTMAPDAQVVDTGGTIYPGLIDTHNHIHYNAVPIWQLEPHLENGYTNRYQWKNHPDYKTEVTWPKKLLGGPPQFKAIPPLTILPIPGYWRVTWNTTTLVATTCIPRLLSWNRITLAITSRRAMPPVHLTLGSCIYQKGLMEAALLSSVFCSRMTCWSAN